MAKRNRGYQIMINAVMLLVVVTVVVPFLLLFMSSITDENTLLVNGYSFFPEKFSLGAYAYIFRSGDKIFRAYGMTVLVTLFGTLVNVTLSALFAYPLSLKNLPGKRGITFFVFFTMLFNGGLVPSYILWSNYIGVKDSIWGLLLPGLLMSAMNVLLIRTYFSTSIPDTLFEAAEIDGAGQMTIFAKIVLPLGKPILVTIGTFSGLAYWNDWTNGLYYITKRTELFTIQNLVRFAVLVSKCRKRVLRRRARAFEGAVHRRADGDRLCGDSADHFDFPVPAKVLCQGYCIGRGERVRYFI